MDRQEPGLQRDHWIKDGRKAGRDVSASDGMTRLLGAVFRGGYRCGPVAAREWRRPGYAPNPSDSALGHAEDDFGLTEIAELWKAYGATK
jgi:hypothetical protein